MAEKDNVKVSGIIFVFDKIIEHNLIPKIELAEKLKKLMEINRRLPLGECNTRIAKWATEK